MSGFPPEIFIDAVSRAFHCPLCLNVLNDPRECTNGHAFCRECLNESLTLHKFCPICRIPLTTSHKKTLLVNSYITELSTKCPSTTILKTNIKCDWIGALTERQTHYEKDCSLFPIICPNHCGANILRKNLENHLKIDCPQQLIICSFYTDNGCFECDGYLRRSDVDAHVSHVPRLRYIISNLTTKMNKIMLQDKLPVANQKTAQQKLGTCVEYENKKGNWVKGNIMSEDITIPGNYNILNAHERSVSVKSDKIRLVKGSEMVVLSVTCKDNGRRSYHTLVFSGTDFVLHGSETVYQMISKHDLLSDESEDGVDAVTIQMNTMLFLTSQDLDAELKGDLKIAAVSVEDFLCLEAILNNNVSCLDSA